MRAHAAPVAVHMAPAELAALMADLTRRLESAAAGSRAAQAAVAALGGCSRALGHRFGPFVERAVPLLVARCDEASSEDGDAKEGCLLALTNIVQFCSEVRAPVLQTACLRTCTYT